LLLHLGDAPRSTLADLFTAPSPRSDVCDLTVPLSAEQLQTIAELPAPLARCFDGEFQVADLIAAAGTL
jgi:hypothetical protein